MPIVIREGRFEDSKGIATVHLLTWQQSYRDFFPHEKLDNYSIEEYALTWEKRIQSNEENEISLFVAEDKESGIVGFATGGRAGIFTKPSIFDCEIYTIYVLNDYHRRGIGSKLVHQLLQVFRLKEWKSMIIWTFKESIFRLFYEKLGGIPREFHDYEKWNTKHELSGYVWDDISEISL